jgi:serine phosphatase RsbU (regulator of sigma subunit)
VLQPIKKPEMFATFAYLAWNGERLEYSSAGHPAILHYRAATAEIVELACPNVPLGLLERPEFVSQFVECAPHDLFVLVTDGLLETTNSKGEEFGPEGVKSVLSSQNRSRASAIFDALLAAAQRHGVSTDDLSLLLVRCT